MRPQKFILTADRLAQRIQKGDYQLHGLPAERELALQLGVSHMTARKAIERLIDQKLLYRQANGRAAVQPPRKGRARTSPPQIALLAPAWQSPSITGWQLLLARLRERCGMSSRLVHYTHWDDPVLVNTIQRFDGTFLIPESDPVPKGFPEMLAAIGRPLVVLDDDWSEYGIRSIVTVSRGGVHRLLDHLASLGHRKIDCLNVQPGEADPIRRWRVWLAAHHLDGELIEELAEPFTHPIPVAYQAVAGRIRKGQFRSKALFCVTEPAAAGAMRALIEHGLRPGHDVAVCTADAGMRTEYCNPPLTAAAGVERDGYLVICLDWMLHPRERAWHGPLLLQPDDEQIVVRASTVPQIAGSRPRRETAARNGRRPEKV